MTLKYSIFSAVIFVWTYVRCHCRDGVTSRLSASCSWPSAAKCPAAAPVETFPDGFSWLSSELWIRLTLSTVSAQNLRFVFVFSRQKTDVSRRYCESKISYQLFFFFKPFFKTEHWVQFSESLQSNSGDCTVCTVGSTTQSTRNTSRSATLYTPSWNISKTALPVLFSFAPRWTNVALQCQ